MRQPTTFGLVTTFTILAFHGLDPCLACNSNRNSNKKQLKDVRQLTFQESEWIRAKDVRRYIFPQLYCAEGSAGCDFELDQVTCYNKGVVDEEVKWSCRAPKVIKFPYRFGMTEVWCNRRFWRNNRPTTYITDDMDCGLVYTVEYVGDTFACGILIGVVMIFGGFRVYKIYFKSAESSSSPSSSEATRPEDIIFDDDHIWGRGPLQTGGKCLNVEKGEWSEDGDKAIPPRHGCREGSSYRRRGPHSIGGGGTISTGAGTSLNGEGGGNCGGDMHAIPYQSASKAEIDEDEDNWTRVAISEHGRSRQMSRTSTNASSSISIANRE